MNEIPRIEANTAIRFFVESTTYTQGKGSVSDWIPISAIIGTDRRGNNISTSYFYVEWKDSFGSQALELAAKNVETPARIRMAFDEKIVKILRKKDVLIEKDGDESDVYEINGGVSDYKSRRVLMEFNVKKREVKS